MLSHSEKENQAQQAIPFLGISQTLPPRFPHSHLQWPLCFLKRMTQLFMATQTFSCSISGGFGLHCTPVRLRGTMSQPEISQQKVQKSSYWLALPAEESSEGCDVSSVSFSHRQSSTTQRGWQLLKSLGSHIIVAHAGRRWCQM